MKSFVYETMYILRPDLNEEQVEQAIAKYKDLLLEQGAVNLEAQKFGNGKRRLAYPINKHREGVYIQMNYQGPPTQVAVLEKSLRLSEDILRYLTVKQAVKEAKPEEETIEE